MFCIKCGNKLDEGASFCRMCGARAITLPAADAGSPFEGIPANENERTRQHAPTHDFALSSAVYNMGSAEYATAIQNRYAKPNFFAAFFSLLIPFLGLIMYFAANKSTRAAQVYFICFKINIAFWAGYVALCITLTIFASILGAIPL